MEVQTSKISNPWATKDSQDLRGTSSVIGNRENEIKGSFTILAEVLEDVDEVIGCTASTKNNEVFLRRHL